MVEIGKPSIGMVVRGRCLWREQPQRGVEHAPYSRPCLVMRVFEREGKTLASVLPMTTKPQPDGNGFELPAEIARRIHLPRGISHVVTAQSKTVDWTPDFYEDIPGHDTPVYGHLTPGLTRKAGNQYLENMQKTKADVAGQGDGTSRSPDQLRSLHQDASARSAGGRGGDIKEPDQDH